MRASVTIFCRDHRHALPLALYVCFLCYSKAGINDMFEGHQGPVTGIDCHNVPGAIDFSHYFITSSFDWTVKLWNMKVGSCTLYFLPNCPLCRKPLYEGLRLSTAVVCCLVVSGLSHVPVVAKACFDFTLCP